MSKAEKRLRKTLGSVQNALIIGLGFGLLNDTLKIFKSVFVINDIKTNIKSRNLIYRENFKDLSMISDISVVFVDRNNVHAIENIEPILYRHRPLILVEGDEVITREFSSPLYKANYRAVEKCGFYHIWKYKE